VGYVYNQTRGDGPGTSNFRLRLALRDGVVNPESMIVKGEQYGSFDDMVEANHGERPNEEDEALKKDHGMTNGIHVFLSDAHLSATQINDGSCIGNVEATLVGDGHWWLARAKVREGFQGKGIGSALLKKVQERLYEVEDFKGLEVAPGGYGSDLNRVTRFYERHGFMKSRGGTYWWRGRDVIEIMRKFLAHTLRNTSYSYDSLTHAEKELATRVEFDKMVMAIKKLEDNE
jgi:ribosomal protein S18 acetylase RimI-like enzyme